MLFIESNKSNECKKLNSKMFSIHVTNVCNLACGGCDQFCGYFNKDKHFFISLEELENNIQSFYAYRDDNWGSLDFPNEEKVFLLYGGEPTLHPEFDDLLEILYKHDGIPFVIYTNGRSFLKELKDVELDVHCRDISKQVYKSNLPRDCYPEFQDVFKRFHSCHKNVAYRIDYKTKDVRGDFVATLCAPCDIEENNNPNGKYYWERAKNICYKWNSCENSIYNNKAYCCNVAASMDHMFFNGEHGWDVKKGKNPFCKSAKEIEKQMENFCYRCGYNCAGGLKGFKETMDTTQYIHKGSLITETNKKNIDKKSLNFPKLQVIEKPQETCPTEVFR